MFSDIDKEASDWRRICAQLLASGNKNEAKNGLTSIKIAHHHTIRCSWVQSGVMMQYGFLGAVREPLRLGQTPLSSDSIDSLATSTHSYGYLFIPLDVLIYCM